jgi:hypothetical protein
MVGEFIKTHADPLGKKPNVWFVLRNLLLQGKIPNVTYRIGGEFSSDFPAAKVSYNSFFCRIFLLAGLGCIQYSILDYCCKFEPMQI